MRNDEPSTIKLSMPQKRAKPVVPVPGSVKWSHRSCAGFKFTLFVKRTGVACLSRLFSAPLTCLINVATNSI